MMIVVAYSTAFRKSILTNGSRIWGFEFLEGILRPRQAFNGLLIRSHISLTPPITNLAGSYVSCQLSEGSKLFATCACIFTVIPQHIISITAPNTNKTGRSMIYQTMTIHIGQTYMKAMQCTALHCSAIHYSQHAILNTMCYATFSYASLGQCRVWVHLNIYTTLQPLSGKRATLV